MIVFGGRGVFGRIVVDLLRKSGIFADVASRSTGTEITDFDSCRKALDGQDIAIHCAGPYHKLDDTLLRACLETDTHYVDIADDREYCEHVRGMGEAFRVRGLTAAYGCSTFPSIAEALAVGMKKPRAALLVGNRNPKGRAAVASLLRNLDQFRDGVVVEFPKPWGRRRAYTVIAPGDLETKACFESRLGTWWMSFLGRYRLPGAKLLVGIGRMLSFFGSSGGAVLCEDLDGNGRACVHSLENGQLMAALPAVFAAAAIAQGTEKLGAMTGCELLGAPELLAYLENAGFTVERDT